MSDLDSVIRVTITVQESSLGRKGFGIPLIAGYHTKWPERVRTYRKLKELTDDGFLTSDAIYRAASRMLRPAPTVGTFKVGRLAGTPVTQLVSLTPTLQPNARYTIKLNDSEFSTQIFKFTPTVVNSTTYTITVNGKVYTVASDSSATAGEIVSGLNGFVSVINADPNRVVTASGTTVLVLTANNQPAVSVVPGANWSASAAPTTGETNFPLVTAINASTVPVTAGDVGGAITLTADAAGVNFALEASSSFTAQDTTADAAIATELAAISEVDDDWYSLALLGTGKAEILAAAAYIEGTEKIMLAVTGDSDVITSATTDVASTGKTNAYNRSALMWLQNPSEYGNAGLLGRVLSRDPGSSTFSYKNVPGLTPTKFSSTVASQLKTKNVISYTTIAGVSLTMNGKMLSGRWVDIQIGLDFLKARIQEEIFLTLTMNEKVPYDSVGIELLASAVRGALKMAQGNGIVAENSWEVKIPTISEISALDRQNRVLNSLDWKARLLGAVEEVDVEGNVIY